MIKKILTVFTSLCFLFICKNLYAWGNELSHPFITEKTVQQSVLNEYLVNELGLSSSLNTTLE